MNRRDILLASASAAVGAVSRAMAADAPAGAAAVPPPPPKPWAPPPDDYAPVSARARALYERALVFDANSGPPGQEMFPLPAAMLDLSRSSGVTAVKTTMGGLNSNFVDTVDEIAWYLRAIETHPDVFAQIRVAPDFARAKREKKLGILLSFESAEMFEGKIERILIFRNLGVRVMQLSYNKTSPFASGVMADRPTGLTELGRKAVAEMNKQGVAIDISHASPPSYADTLAASAKPVLVTHAGCMAVHRHPRNKTDEQLRFIAERGGFVGVTMFPAFLKKGTSATVEDYVEAIEYVINLCGEDIVGIGTDFTQGYDRAFFDWITHDKGSGRKLVEFGEIINPEGMRRIGDFPNLTAAMERRGWSEGRIRKVMGGNWLQLLRDVWGR